MEKEIEVTIESLSTAVTDEALFVMYDGDYDEVVTTICSGSIELTGEGL